MRPGPQRGATRPAGTLGLGAVVLLLASALVAGPGAPAAAPRARGLAAAQADSSGCEACHAGIEAMHPEAGLSCVDCHGGDGAATSKVAAHVPEPRVRLEDERVAPLTHDLAWRRFRNPMDLRVAEDTCGLCHEQDVAHLMVSLHVTTAGHLSDGYYEMGLSEERGSRYSVFPASDPPREGGAVERLVQVPPFDDRGPEDELATHYTDLARKECMQCHLWSEGRAVDGRVGFDGDYRGEGCAACHVEYALDGLSESADPTVPANEPGHPRRHSMTRAPSTDTCTSCHYGDASIGLHFRGLSQLPPDTPGGPEIPGTTDRLRNRVFYLDDPAICPPDVHYERGMHCIDCHTQDDVMGDGRLHGQMEHAVEISCEACHGTFDRPSELVTERGTPLEHLRRDGERVILTSKVTGADHVVPQAAHVTDPDRPEYNPRAAEAMTGAHGEVECYTCHAGWNVNFLGFHFSRIASLSQLDLLAGDRTDGRVTTQEKVFATWKSFYAGRNEAGRIAPYLTGFSTMGSVWDEEGELRIDQAMPVTQAGLSGMTMIHHQLHSTRPTARECVECHRAPATWGLGSANFQLARQLAFVADRRGIEIVALDRREPTRSAALTKLVLPDVVALEVDCDPLQGHARYVFAAEGGRGVHVLDVRDPTAPRTVGFVATDDPQALHLAGDHLWVADGEGGVRVLDVSEPSAPAIVGHLASFDARDIEVRWPWAYVADGPGGLLILDAEAPIAPRVLSALDVNGATRVPNETVSVATLFQYSRPLAEDGVPLDRRQPARNLACVLDRRLGLITVDVTEPTAPRVLWPQPDGRTESRRFGAVTYRGLAVASDVDRAERQGGERTRERDYVYVQQERGPAANRRSQVVLFDVSDPRNVRLRSALEQGYDTEGVAVADFYNPPFRQRLVFSPGKRGVVFGDATESRDPTTLGRLPGLGQAYVVAFERFPLDRMIDEEGARLKDISHPGSGWLLRDEVLRVLQVPAEELAWAEGPVQRRGDGDPGADVAWGGAVRLHLREYDDDRSGALEGDEVDAAGARTHDADGDGRVTLIELARAGGDLGLEPGSPPPPPAERSRLERLGQDGDLARLLDRVNPWDFDRDGDDALQQRELQAAVFAALDLDGDEQLTLDELSRYPGPLRRLRLRDAEALETFGRLDRSGDDVLARREFQLAEAEVQALDPDGDGEVRLVRPESEFFLEVGAVEPSSEWPSRRPLPAALLPLPPGFTVDAFLERFDEDGDGLVTVKELDREDGLFEWLDNADSKDSRISRADLEKGLRVFTTFGVELAPDGFAARWDVDRDGRVVPDELPEGVRLRLLPHLERRSGARRR